MHQPSCFQTKVDAHIAVTLAAKPKLVQISTAHNRLQEGSPVLPRNKYVAIQD
jgi:ParB family chromosome partitioning protein